MSNRTKFRSRCLTVRLTCLQLIWTGRLYLNDKKSAGQEINPVYKGNSNVFS